MRLLVEYDKIRFMKILYFGPISKKGQASIGCLLYTSFIGITLAFSTTFYVRKIHILKVKLTWFEFKTIAKPLFLLGLSFSFSGFISTVMTLLSRSYLSNHFELKAVGIYQASWTISNLYIGIILTAMGVDFMPRLMKVIGNKEEVNKMINQQLETGILLSSIGVVSILLFSDLFLYLLYSKEFESGSEIIRWQVLGVMTVSYTHLHFHLVIQ